MTSANDNDHSIDPETNDSKDTSDLPFEDEKEIRARTLEILKGSSDTIGGRSLISLLQAIQEEFGYLPKASMREIATFLGISEANVYGTATFYNQFRFVPPGKYHVRVCMGTACAIKLGGVILESWERRLNIKEGGVTPDREYSIERVACVGCCAMAPVTVIGEEVYGDMAPTKVDGILLQHELARKQEQKQSDSSEESTEK